MKKRLLFILMCVVMVFQTVTFTAVAQPEEIDYSTLRLKWYDFLTGGDDYDLGDSMITDRIASITADANNLWSTMNTDEGVAYLWSTANSWTISNTTTSNFNNLYKMALAYKTYGSDLYNNADLLADIIYGLEWLNTTKYNTTIARYDNWYDWEIGTPKTLVNILVLLYDDMPDALSDSYIAAIDRYTPAPGRYNMNESTGTGTTSTGANRVWLALIHSLNGVITQRSDKIVAGRDALSNVFDYVTAVGTVTAGDGFYEDGSFIQHTYFSYTGGYGAALLTELSNVLYLLNGSYWQVTDTDVNNVYKWVQDSFKPIIYKGSMMDMVTGREMSRYTRTSHTSGRGVMQALVVLAETAPPAQRDSIASLVKLWSDQDTSTNIYEGSSLFKLLKARTLLASAQPAVPFTGYKQFPSMDRAVFHNNGYAAGLAMHSYDRTRNFEIVNNENKKGYYTAAGTLYLYNDDLTQFDGDFWPTVNPYRMPGTTVLRDTGLTSSTRSNNFAGGVDMDGIYGASGMIYTPRDSSNAVLGLDARKSYFMFDDEIVAMGTASSTAVGKSVETIVENRKINLAGDNTFSVNGVDSLPTLTTSTTEENLTNVNWAHLQGNTTGSDIGYYFPQSANLMGIRQTRTGTWQTINTQYYTTDTKTNNFLTLRYAHGEQPTDATYAYTLLPNKTKEQTGAYNANPDIEIVKNTSRVQAVKEKNLGITGINFFTDEVNYAGILKSNKKASVIMKQTSDAEGNILQVSASDPTWGNTGNIELAINAPYVSTISADSSVNVSSVGSTTVLTINVSGKRGAPQKATLRIGEATVFTEEPAPEPTTSPSPSPTVTPDPTIVADEMLIQDDVERSTLKIGDTGSKIASTNTQWNNSFSTSAKVAYDPIDPAPATGSNRTVQFNGGTSASNPSAKKYANAGLPLVISGRVLLDASESGTNFMLRICDNNASKQIYLMRIQGSTLQVATNTGSTMPSDSPKVLPGQWVNFTAYYGATNNRNVLYLTGGITDSAGNSIPYAVFENTAVPNSLITAATSGRTPEFYLGFPAASTSHYYLDDVLAYRSNSFVPTITNNTNVATNAKIDIAFNHEVDIRTLLPENITLTSDAGTVAVTTIDKTPEDLTTIAITPTSILNPGTTYQVNFTGVKDWAGETARTTSFTTAGVAPEIVPIEALNINTPTNLNQFSDNLSAIQFVVDTTPAENVDASTIKWYVNDALQLQTGRNFTYTPTVEGTYSVYAMVDGTEVYSEERTITVAQATGQVSVSSITLNPTTLKIWADFTLPIEAKTAVIPADASNQTLEWLSDNPAVATVGSSTGIITPVSPGTANITARATDGSGVISNALVLEVTPAQNRAVNQKLNLDPVSGSQKRINVNTYLAWPQNVGEGQIALWANNATGAFSATADDSLEYDFNTWKNWKNKYGFPATFFVPTKAGYIEDFSYWQDMIDNGMDIQSHTLSHLDSDQINALSSAQQIREFYTPIEDINRLVGADSARTLAFSYGTGNETYSRPFYIAARGTSGLLNKADTVNYNRVGSISLKGSLNIFHNGTRTNTMEDSIKTLYDNTGTYKQYGATFYGGWMNVHSHGLNTSKLSNSDLKTLYAQEHPDATQAELDALTFGTKDLLDCIFERLLKPAVEEGQIWVDSFTNVAKYGQQRDTAVLSVLSSTLDEITYTLTDSMDDTYFTYPLTVKFKVDNSWNTVNAVQDGKQLDVSMVTVDGSKYALVQTVPDKGIVALTPAQAVLYGDVSGDGAINITDVIMAAEIAVGGTNYTAEQVLRANVSSKQEAMVDISDVVLLVERVIGGTTPFPVEQE